MKRTRILIVEDEGIIARDIERQLSGLAYEPVGLAGSGEEAIALAGELRPQIVLMDIHLSGAMDGIDAALIIRERFNIPCIFLTAYATDEVIERAKHAEPLGYILKSFDEESLHTTIEVALHKERVDYQLRLSESRYRAVVQSSHDAAVTADGTGQIVGWSPSAVRIFGYTATEAIGQPLTMLMPARYELAHLAGLQRTRGYAGPVAFDARRQMEGRGKDGSEFPVELSLAKWETAEGWFITAMIRDISERIQAESSLRLQSAALNAAANAIIITDGAGTLLWVNAAFSVLTGYTAEEAVGRNSRDLVKSGVHGPAFYEELWRTLLRGEVWTGELTNRRKDGSTYVEEQTITPLRNANGAITHFIGVKRDVTSYKRLQEQFLQSQKMDVVGQLAGGIAHDFNNLLTVINGTASLALAELPSYDPSRERFELVKQAGDRAAQLTRQLLAIGRRQAIAPVVLDLGVHVANTTRLLQRVIGESINLVIRASDDLDPVLADPGQLEQVVLNLAVNARDAMPRGGTLTIDMRNVDLDEAFAAAHPGVSTGPHVALSLTDTGSGMTPEVSSRIFEPFFTTKRQGKGTGLGLATVYGIVTRSGGAITVESQPGWGSSFRIFLPRATSASVTWEPPVQTDYSNGSETILLTEDEDSARELTMRMLEAAGYTVLTANSGSTALSILERYGKPLHLLLTDVVMPGMSGPELASSAKLMHPNLPILFVSGYTDDAVFSDGVSRGASHFLSKPYTLTELASKVRQVLDTATGGV